MANNQQLVCVGQMALRSPDGTALPAVPLYERMAVNLQTKRSASEIKVLDGFVEAFAPLLKKHIDVAKATRK